ncbi:MAG: hypothetical protein IKR28_02795 [Selenomonadaceae bacterium]|nr:hypothetical protein [Selenomonadaceae bacterium]
MAYAADKSASVLPDGNTSTQIVDPGKTGIVDTMNNDGTQNVHTGGTGCSSSILVIVAPTTRGMSTTTVISAHVPIIAAPNVNSSAPAVSRRTSSRKQLCVCGKIVRSRKALRKTPQRLEFTGR